MRYCALICVLLIVPITLFSMNISCPQLELFDSICLENLDELKQLCKDKKVRVNDVLSLNRTALLWACRASENFTCAAVEVLLKMGADISVHDGNKDTIFHLAASRADSYPIMALLFRVRDIPQELINQRNDYGHTPLMLASHAGCTQSVQLLLSKGADPTLNGATYMKYSIGWTALHYAVKAGHVNCVKALLEHERRQTTAASNVVGYAPLVGVVDVSVIQHCLDLPIERNFDISIAHNHTRIKKLLNKHLLFKTQLKENEQPKLLSKKDDKIVDAHNEWPKKIAYSALLVIIVAAAMRKFLK